MVRKGVGVRIWNIIIADSPEEILKDILKVELLKRATGLVLVRYVPQLPEGSQN